MWHNLNCKSTYLVYLVTCMKCWRQYVGSTINTMATRHTQHRQEIKDKSTNLGRHFDDCGYENFSLQVISCVKPGEDEALERVEGFWQHCLRTFVEDGGLNVRDEVKYNVRRAVK